MKILLISSYIFGYMDIAVAEMRRQGHEVTVFYYEEPPLKFSYQNKWDQTKAGVQKLLGKNAKKEARETALKTQLKDKKFDFTLLIHGQYLNHETHIFLKSISERYVAYFFDSLAKMPEQKKIEKYFDTVFSFEPDDCKEFGYQFITNFIPAQNFKSEKFDYCVFNIGGRDERFSETQKLAAYLDEKEISHRFVLFDKSKTPGFEQIEQKLTVFDVLPMIQKSKIMLDMQRYEQKGLTFRVFEALGNDKKILTTNTDIVRYDFYSPKNILIFNPDDIHIPKEFLKEPYQPINVDIIQKYTVENWVHKILQPI